MATWRVKEAGSITETGSAAGWPPATAKRIFHPTNGPIQCMENEHIEVVGDSVYLCWERPGTLFPCAVRVPIEGWWQYVPLESAQDAGNGIGMGGP